MTRKKSRKQGRSLFINLFLTINLLLTTETVEEESA